MTADIFREFLRSLDSRMQNQSRKVALILDRCRAHYTNINLTNVDLLCLLPNTTSKTQPLDGIINSMKCNYKKRLIHKLLLSYETKIEFKLTLLDALNDIKLLGMMLNRR